MTENRENREGRDNTAVISNAVLFNRKSMTKSYAKCPLSGKDAPVIDHKNVELLRKFVSEKGRIIPSRVTGVSAKKQRKLKLAIKRARNLALLPFTTI